MTRKGAVWVAMRVTEIWLLPASSTCWFLYFKLWGYVTLKKIRNVETITYHRIYFAKQAHLKWFKAYFKGISTFKMSLFSQVCVCLCAEYSLQTDTFCDMQVTGRGFNESFHVSLSAVHHLWAGQSNCLFIASSRMRQETAASCWYTTFALKLSE